MAIGRPCSSAKATTSSGAGDRVRGARDQGRAGALGDVPGGDLVAQVADGLRRRADPGQPGVQDGLGEVGVLGKEAVAGVDGVGAGFARPRQHLGHVQIAGGRGVTAQCVCLVGRAHMQSVPVRIGVDGYARDPGIPAGTGDADSDFATVGDEHLAHDGSLLAVFAPLASSGVTRQVIVPEEFAGLLSVKSAEFRDCRHGVSTCSHG